MKNCLLVECYLCFQCCRDAGCCEYKSSLKRSKKNKGSGTVRLLAKRTVGLNAGMCIYSVFLFIRTICNLVFLFHGRLTLQNSMKNIIEKNVLMQPMFLVLFLFCLSMR